MNTNANTFFYTQFDASFNSLHKAIKVLGSFLRLFAIYLLLVARTISLTILKLKYLLN